MFFKRLVFLVIVISSTNLKHTVMKWVCLTGKKSHLRKTTEKKPPTKESISKLQQSDVWKMENEFYEFALEQFQFVRAHGVREKDGELFVLAQNFFYEKIYPKVNWNRSETTWLLIFVFSIITTEGTERGNTSSRKQHLWK